MQSNRAAVVMEIDLGCVLVIYIRACDCLLKNSLQVIER